MFFSLFNLSSTNELFQPSTRYEHQTKPVSSTELLRVEILMEAYEHQLNTTRKLAREVEEFHQCLEYIVSLVDMLRQEDRSPDERAAILTSIHNKRELIRGLKNTANASHREMVKAEQTVRILADATTPFLTIPTPDYELH